MTQMPTPTIEGLRSYLAYEQGVTPQMTDALERVRTTTRWRHLADYVEALRAQVANAWEMTNEIIDDGDTVALKDVGPISPSLLREQLAWLQSFPDWTVDTGPEYHAAGLANLVGAILELVETGTVA